MSRTDHQMKIRVSEELKEMLENSATENKRSMNAEITHRLQQSFQGDMYDAVIDLKNKYPNLWKTRVVEGKDTLLPNTELGALINIIDLNRREMATKNKALQEAMVKFINGLLTADELEAQKLKHNNEDDEN
ncbi:Arc family DNA-binding protein [Serratia liquefaciens]|uniref:Arc family DNA-binding protein n=1 Tax=Serratia liquefaciens TaxID=614 RepID=UPI00059E9ECD|nr:Arc family DNA-binding protein [Serratia liquefaciens]